MRLLEHVKNTGLNLRVAKLFPNEAELFLCSYKQYESWTCLVHSLAKAYKISSYKLINPFTRYKPLCSRALPLSDHGESFLPQQRAQCLWQNPLARSNVRPRLAHVTQLLWFLVSLFFWPTILWVSTIVQLQPPKRPGLLAIILYTQNCSVFSVLLLSDELTLVNWFPFTILGK